MRNAEINRNRRANRLFEHEQERQYTKDDWKEKAYFLAKAYGDSLKHLDEKEAKISELETFIERIKADNRILINIIRVKELKPLF